MASFAGKGRGDHFLAEADKHLKKFSFFGAGSKFEDAAECFSKAGNCFKVEQKWQEAGEAYMQAADLLQNKVQSSHEASAAMMDAGNCFKKVSAPDAINAFRGAISNWCEAGRFNQAAKLTKEIAEMYEKDNNPVEAIENYTQAATFFETENSKSMTTQCNAKVAELCSAVLDPPDLARAADIYEELGKGCLDSALIKYNAKGYFLSCVFCHLAQGDAVAARQKVDLFGGLDFSFRESREGQLCDKLVTAVEEFDADGFSTACYEFDRVSKLDAWKTSILVQIKRAIEGSGEGEDEDEVDLM
ncbi:hypothetical protein TrVE_jg14402 [Triparma verrucosa]|uniref:Alpha-SNAP n=1 Tax=Triparma verrucosa TaxID=1606542 RepID=A0A9W7BIL6_9STRA|nr:hypothetical protein TrVE_jg14402 [Triparma verrucosa]